MADGDLACPSGLPNKHMVGTSATLSCSACPCTLSATCSGTATFYSDSGCTNAVATVSTATCSATNGVNYASYKWTGTTNTMCNLGASTASVALAGVATICCP
jgi:hypothetical protein